MPKGKTNLNEDKAAIYFIPEFSTAAEMEIQPIIARKKQLGRTPYLTEKDTTETYNAKKLMKII